MAGTIAKHAVPRQTLLYDVLLCCVCGRFRQTAGSRYGKAGKSPALVMLKQDSCHIESTKVQIVSICARFPSLSGAVASGAVDFGGFVLAVALQSALT